MVQIRMENEVKAGLEESELSQYERQLGLKLPQQYRNFLLEFNGGSPRPSRFTFKDCDTGSQVLSFFGFGSFYDVLEELETYGGRLPKRFFPIAAESGGNLLCISLSGEDSGNIYFWDHELEAELSKGQTPDSVNNTTLVADSFSEFLDSFCE
ncbi:MAG: SMI1/KNR4 family protein [Candidatus Obscuribacter sp.]|nr:SMI1/KNR4 family protein [Candidatus Obscuribacter sp.]MBK9618922.1 SMI1/KNR4 family protein [Candidatus Obscuribacter sp.]MBP6351209.1 SMI1/KNR4 family protein [Candidatus Obscuribacter sp.]MBP6592236.1 SMI1/KNR4 family protein [Candidatus Obscuribacter sp.]MBP7577477.1 SMI1/KNR4 family protein [Candidatus Obscuribacter sp.]